jgi:hypothetical protein
MYKILFTLLIESKVKKNKFFGQKNRLLNLGEEAKDGYKEGHKWKFC